MDNKEILLKCINIMNETPEFFKKNHLEDAIQIISSKQYADIKSSVKGINLFKKKPAKVEQKNILSALDLTSKKYNINVDVENNLIVLVDKEIEEKHIVFCELTHKGMESLNLYYSLINSMEPDLVLVEQEPYQISKVITKGDILSTEVNEYSSFENLNKFKEFIKEYNRYYTFKKDYVYDLSRSNYCEVESIVYNSLRKNKKIFLLDMPFSKYTKSFVKSFDSYKYNKEEFKQIASVLNINDIITWVAVQENIGCKKCASFLNKKAIDWSPYHLEFIMKDYLPNYKYILDYKTHKINDKIKSTKKNVMVFSSNINDLCKGVLQTDNLEHISKEDEREEINFTSDDLDLITLALNLKENYHKYITNPPFELHNVKQEDFKRYQKAFKNNIEQLYCLNSTLNIEDENSNCESVKYFATLNEISNKI